MARVPICPFPVFRFQINCNREGEQSPRPRRSEASPARRRHPISTFRMRHRRHRSKPHHRARPRRGVGSSLAAFCAFVHIQNFAHIAVRFATASHVDECSFLSRLARSEQSCTTGSNNPNPVKPKRYYSADDEGDKQRRVADSTVMGTGTRLPNGWRCPSVRAAPRC